MLLTRGRGGEWLVRFGGGIELFIFLAIFGRVKLRF